MLAITNLAFFSTAVISFSTLTLLEGHWALNISVPMILFRNEQRKKTRNWLTLVHLENGFESSWMMDSS